MNNAAQIRLGQVSTIDYEHGMISVQYPDLDGSVSDKMPMLSFNGEYKMPDIDDTVVVINLSNGSSIGIILGAFWNKANRPKTTGRDVYRKEISSSSYVEFKDATLTLYAPHIKLVTNQGSQEY